MESVIETQKSQVKAGAGARPMPFSATPIPSASRSGFYGAGPLLAFGLPLQAKLEVGSPDDPLEAEADAMADRVLRMPAAASSADFGVKRGIQRKCAGCQDEQDEGDQVQRKGVSTQVGETAAPAIVKDVLRSPGQPLDSRARAFFEPRLGFNLSRVRIHTDPKASESARSVDALAYTAGSDIAFAAGQYQPQTERGRRLIAHELAHVLQQSGGDQGQLRRLGDVSQAPSVLSCPIPQSNVPATNEFVLFPNGGTTLGAAQKAMIGNYVERYNASGGGVDVRVDGFASEPGSDTLNWRLSCERASSVRDELVQPTATAAPGLPPSLINVFMQGETAEFGAVAQNRRATIFPPLAGTMPVFPADNGNTSQAPPTTDNTAPGPTGNGTPPQPDTDIVEAAPERPECARNQDCPDDYCMPFPTRQQALDDRALNGASVLITISGLNAHATPLYRRYVFNPGPAGDVSAQLADDFTSSGNTRATTQQLTRLLEAELQSHPPVFPPGVDRVSVDFESDISRSAFKAQIDHLVTTGLIFDNPFEAPGLLAGGVGLDQASCNVGADTSGAQPDSRSAHVVADVIRNPDGTFLITPAITFTVVDTLDFCPGNCGGFLAQILGNTVFMSRWEASNISGDVPFTVHFPAPLLIGAFDSEDI